jgi:hypothetical protein
MGCYFMFVFWVEGLGGLIMIGLDLKWVGLSDGWS